ncbi:hypothetical protein F5884DRAFT_47507 [Xylogone sp. PMI_703]|nr:hypothetical protein F5884DRAFT_47507 [Xylogone sp. PMI_703]
MPSVAPVPTATTLRKRRRDEAGSIELQMKLSSLPLPRHATLPGDDDGTRFSIDGMEEQFLPEQARRHIIPKSRRLQLQQHDSKRQRVEIGSNHLVEHQHGSRDISEYGYQLQQHQAPHVNVNNSCAKPTIDLSPCHICYRKPTTRSDLDSFAYCESCEKRTCYVCIRECERYMGYDVDKEGEDEDMLLQPSSFSFAGGEKSGVFADLEKSARRKFGHRRMVCSRCCVERGAEGEVWCMGCLRAEASGWDGS